MCEKYLALPPAPGTPAPQDNHHRRCLERQCSSYPGNHASRPALYSVGKTRRLCLLIRVYWSVRSARRGNGVFFARLGQGGNASVTRRIKRRCENRLSKSNAFLANPEGEKSILLPNKHEIRHNYIVTISDLAHPTKDGRLGCSRWTKIIKIPSISFITGMAVINPFNTLY